MDTKETNPEENQVPKQLGELLKSYRKTANMDIDQAADTLCLTAGTLKALENEDFDQLPEAPYLRGYLRGYAKLANVNSAEVISLYEDMRGGSSAPADTQYNFSPSTSIDEFIKPIVPSYIIQLGTLAVALLLLAVIYMIPGVKEWSGNIWNEFSQQNVVAEQDNTENSPKPIEKTPLAVANTTAQPSQPSPAQQVISTANTSSPNSNQENSPVKMEGTIKRENTNSNDIQNGDNKKAETTASAQSTDSITTNDEPVETVALAENTSTPTAAQAEANNSTDTNTTVEASTPTPPAPATTTSVDMASIDAASGEVMVKLVFKDEVWMRVSSKRKKVFSGLKKAGDAEEFKTKKPLSFKVGNAPGVDIYVNGKLYDQTPHMRGVVAKFKVEDI